MQKLLPAFLLDPVLNLLFPPFCQNCALEGSFLCIACQNTIEAPVHRCPVCGKNSLLGRIHDECQSKSDLSGLLVSAEYRNPAVRNLIWHLKYNSVYSINRTLALLMTDFLIKSDLADYFADSIVVPVPAHRKRIRFRGFNQAAEIALSLAGNLRLQYCDALVKLNSTKRQVDLPREKRLSNVKDQFELRNLLRKQLLNKKIILVDDVATTGATLAECASSLSKCDPAEIWGLVVARN